MKGSLLLSKNYYFCRDSKNGPMSNPYFQFKQFTVWHDKCAMKVGTDGVLLGAWAPVDDARRILDVGTGTGLVALMLAQRSDALITAIEIDESAVCQAIENSERSPWSHRITVVQADFNTYKPDEKYDLIVSNPPYFTNSMRCPDHQRNHARHTDTLTYETLVRRASGLLSESGTLAVVLPAEMAESVTHIACACHLSPVRRLNVRTKPDGDVRRVLLAFRRGERPCEANEQASDTLPCEVEELLTEVERHRYSDAYIALTRDYYLHI